MATVGNNSTNTQINACHSQPYELCQTGNTVSPVPLVIYTIPPRNDFYLEQAQLSAENDLEKALIDLAKCLAEQVYCLLSLVCFMEIQ